MANARTTTDIILNNAIWCLCSLTSALLVCGPVQAEPALFQSQQVTRAGEYTFGIEGPAVDTAGNLYVVNSEGRNHWQTSAARGGLGAVRYVAGRQHWKLYSFRA